MSCYEVILCGFAALSLLVTNVASTCTSTGPTCITASAASCLNLPDGDYQACEDCTIYHSCSGGVNWSNRPCPATEHLGLRGKLVWKQVSRGSGFCDYTSNTCTECFMGDSDGTGGGGGNGDGGSGAGCTSTGPGCITASAGACLTLPDGHYQACESCTIYHSCSGGVVWPNRQCPSTTVGGLRGQLVWRKTGLSTGYCDYSSSTCTECSSSGGGGGGGIGSGSGGCTSTGASCITASTSCQNLPDGDYQACEGCIFYHSCAGGINWPNRPCSDTNYGGLNGKLIWQKTGVNTGFCDYSSSTCTECVSSKPTTSAPKCETNRNSGVLCITNSATSCKNLPNGEYQACEACHIFHTCWDHQIHANRPCPKGSNGIQKVWKTVDLGSGWCDTWSSTCDDCP